MLQNSNGLRSLTFYIAVTKRCVVVFIFCITSSLSGRLLDSSKSLELATNMIESDAVIRLREKIHELLSDVSSSPDFQRFQNSFLRCNTRIVVDLWLT